MAPFDCYVNGTVLSDMEAAQLQATNDSESVTISPAEYERLKAQAEVLTEALRLARLRRFGASSEKAKNPCKYLTWLLKEANNAEPNNPDEVQCLLPWNAPMDYKA